MNENVYDIVVCGSGPAGLTATLYLAREGYNVANITGYEVGGNLTVIDNIHNFPGYTGSGQGLAKAMLEQCKDAGAIFYEYEKVVNVYEEDSYAVFITDSGTVIKAAKAFIDATGCIPKTLNIPGECEFLHNGISFCAFCDGYLYKGQDVVVVGGGDSAISMALLLSKYCKTVTIIHRRNAFSALLSNQAELKKKTNIIKIFNKTLKSISKEENKFIVHLNETDDSGKQIDIKCDGIFYALGATRNNLPYTGNGLYPLHYCAGDNNVFDDKPKQIITACADGAITAMKCIQMLSEKNS